MSEKQIVSGIASGNEMMRRVASLLQRLRSDFPKRRQSRLHLCETLPLGEKRFVALVKFDAEEFLVGGTASSITLLGQIPSRPSHRSEESRS